MTACFRVSVLLCLGAPFAALEDHSLGLAQKLYGWWHAWRCLQFAVRLFFAAGALASTAALQW